MHFLPHFLLLPDFLATFLSSRYLASFLIMSMESLLLEHPMKSNNLWTIFPAKLFFCFLVILTLTWTLTFPPFLPPFFPPFFGNFFASFFASFLALGFLTALL